MATFTCQETSDGIFLRHRQLPSIHMRETKVTSPFLYVPSIPQSNDDLKSIDDTSVSAHFTSIPRAASPCFSISSDAKTYYTAIEVTEVNMQRSASPTISDLGPLTPGSTFSTTSDEVGPDDSRSLVRSTADSSAVSHASSHSRKHSYKESKPVSSRSRTSSCSTTRYRSSSQDIPSRSSSSSRRRSSKRHTAMSGAYGQIHSPTLQQGDGTSNHRRRTRDLVSLHRDSCRLFENGKVETSTPSANAQNDSKQIPLQTRKLNRSYTAPVHNISINRIGFLQNSKTFAAVSPSISPLLQSPQSPTSPAEFSTHPSPETQYQHGNWDPVLRNSLSQGDLQTDEPQEYKPIPATVIDWTSPSTRRREYEKIDRSSRGVRGMWRRFAPSWCQSESRTPFFEEGKTGKGTYEGSVRRFRMDVPDDDDDDDNDGGVEKSAATPNANRKTQQIPKLKWKWTETSVSPPSSPGIGKLKGSGTSGKGPGDKWRYLGITTRKTTSR
ncbi:hypothetical protein FQN55_006581 [Onygenales sp. PD_40]|nr:hypothetical protein FQN55_006581 [Onygenales sp. PD_40]